MIQSRLWDSSARELIRSVAGGYAPRVPRQAGPGRFDARRGTEIKVYFAASCALLTLVVLRAQRPCGAPVDQS